MAKQDPAWLKAMKKEATKLGIPLRELLTKSTKPKAKPKAKSKTMAAAKGGMPMVMKDGKKVPAFAADGIGKMMYGGMAKKKPASKMMAGGMAKKKPAAKMMGGGMGKKSTGYMYGGMAKKSMTKKKK